MSKSPTSTQGLAFNTSLTLLAMLDNATNFMWPQFLGSFCEGFPLYRFSCCTCLHNWLWFEQLPWNNQAELHFSNCWWLFKHNSREASCKVVVWHSAYLSWTKNLCINTTTISKILIYNPGVTFPFKLHLLMPTRIFVGFSRTNLANTLHICSESE